MLFNRKYPKQSLCFHYIPYMVKDVSGWSELNCFQKHEFKVKILNGSQFKYDLDLTNSDSLRSQARTSKALIASEIWM